MQRRAASGDPADPRARRHFSMTPRTQYPVPGSGWLDSVVRETWSLGMAGMEVGDGFGMPRNRAERGLGARLRVESTSAMDQGLICASGQSRMTPVFARSISWMIRWR